MSRMTSRTPLMCDLIDDDEELEFEQAMDVLTVDYHKHTEGGEHSAKGEKLIAYTEQYYALLDELRQAIAAGAPLQIIESLDKAAMGYFYGVCKLGKEMRTDYGAYLAPAPTSIQ